MPIYWKNAETPTGAIKETIKSLSENPVINKLDALAEQVSDTVDKTWLNDINKRIEKERDPKIHAKLIREKARVLHIELVRSGKAGGNIEDQKKILGQKKFDQILSSDALMLKKKGVKLYSTLLSSADEPDATVGEGDFTPGKKFVVNFGNNTSLNYRIGAGDILPPSVSQIRINGQIGERKNTPRPGFYHGKRYLPIYDGDTVEVLKQSVLTEKEVQQAEISENKRLENLRKADTIMNDGKALSDVDLDIQYAKDVEKLGQTLDYQDIQTGLHENGFVLSNAEFIDLAEEQGVQKSDVGDLLRIMTAIFKQESSGNYNAKGVELTSGSHLGTKAIGRYQIMPKNWRAWSVEHFGEFLPVTPKNQDKVAFMQMCEYYLLRKKEGTSPDEYVSKMARDWYGWGVSSTGPTSQEYGASVLGRYKKIPEILIA